MTQIGTRWPPATPKQAAKTRGPLDEHLDVELFKALSDATRASLIACIAKCARPCSVGEVAECCSVDVSVVSRHLSLAERAGVLEAFKTGRSVRYQVKHESVCRVLRGLADALEGCGKKEGTCNDGCC